MLASVTGPHPPRRPPLGRLVSRLLCHECARTLECAVAGVTLATGLWLIWPTDTFGSVVSFQAFRPIGDVPAGVALLALALMVLGGPRHARTPATWVMAAVWGYAAWLFLLSNPAGTGWLWAAGYAVGALWSLLSWRHWGGHRG